jgi:hypothetical protein
MSTASFRELLERCNHTELYQLCREHDIKAAPSADNATLISYLLGEAEPPEGMINEVDSWRYGIMGFLLDHWDIVRSQLECPAQSGDPRACFNCVDAMVLSCLTDNEHNEPLIQLKRRRDP